MSQNQIMPRNAKIGLAVLGVGTILGIALLLYLSPAPGPETGSMPVAPQPVASGGPVVVEPPLQTAPPLPTGFVPAPRPTIAPPVAANVTRVTSVPVSLEGTRISVDFPNQPASQAIRQFGDSVGLQMLLLTSGSGPAVQDTMLVGLHVQNVPLLEGMFQLARVTKLSITQMEPQRVLWRAMPDGSSVGRYFVSGPFAVVLQKIESTSSLSQTGVRPMVTPQLFVQLYAEPTLKGVTFPEVISFDPTVDDTGKPVSFTQTNRGMLMDSQTSRVTLRIPMTMNPEHGRTIPLLKGQAVFSAPARMNVISTSGPTDRITEAAGELEIEIGAFGQTTVNVPTGAGFEIHVRAGRMDPAKFSRMVNVQNMFTPTVIADDGSKLTANLASTTRNQPNEYVATYFITNRPNGVSPHHIRLELPGELHDVPVTFEFKDVLIP